MVSCTTILIAVSVTTAAAIPPLSSSQRTQLETATDHSVNFDEAALYPLMLNALEWDPAEPPAGQTPNYDALMASAAEYRGVPFVIEGRLGGDPRTLSRFARPGPWVGKMQQWGVLTGGEDGEVVLVYLVDPPPKVYSGRWVRMTARFYKIWNSVDMQNRETSYLVFVGRGAQVLAGPQELSSPAGTTSPSTPSSPPTTGRKPLSMMVLAVVLLMAGWYYLRRSANVRPLPAQERRYERLERHEEEGRPEEADELDEGPPLPDDPVEALEELERRRAARAAAERAEAELPDELRDLQHVSEE